MITPVNGHLIIQPRESKTYLPTDRGTFEEIGIVIAIAEDVLQASSPLAALSTKEAKVKIGDEIYFDSWLSSKYPTGDGDEEFYLVPWKDVRAIKRNEKDKISE